MNELALFAGAGGGILGGHLLGWRTVCAVEWEQYPASVLCARQNDGLLPPFPIWDDVQTFDGHPWRGIVDVVSGGFPCQDISVAGRGDGLDGERSGMWHHMARIIGEVRPKYAFVENSPMLVTRGLERVIADLTKMGYDSKWGIISASNVGANHRRERIWIVAHSRHLCGRSSKRESNIENGIGRLETSIRSSHAIETTRSSKTSESLAHTKELFSNGSNNNSKISMERKSQSKSRNNSWPENVGDTKSTGFTSRIVGQEQRESWRTSIGATRWWETEPDVGRVADGVAARVDRLKAIGNGQVPLCAATAWRILSDANNI